MWHRERGHLLLVNLEEQLFEQGPTKGRISAAISYQAYQNSILTTYLTSNFASIAAAWQTQEQVQMLSLQSAWAGKGTKIMV